MTNFFVIKFAISGDHVQQRRGKSQMRRHLVTRIAFEHIKQTHVILLKVRLRDRLRATIMPQDGLKLA